MDLEPSERRIAQYGLGFESCPEASLNFLKLFYVMCRGCGFPLKCFFLMAGQYASGVYGRPHRF